VFSAGSEVVSEWVGDLRLRRDIDMPEEEVSGALPSLGARDLDRGARDGACGYLGIVYCHDQPFWSEQEQTRLTMNEPVSFLGSSTWSEETLIGRESSAERKERVNDISVILEGL
jgi:hypothetical protein